MLQLYCSVDRKGNTDRLLREICQNRTSGQILLVPEQFSHTFERKLCEYGGDGVNLYAEVLSFSRLASRVFAAVGGSAESETDASGQLLMMSLAVEQVRSRLKLYGVGAEKPSFLLKLIDTLDELKSDCITPERLRETSKKLSGVLAQKTEEFALLMESFETVCANLGQNPDTRLNRLLGALQESDYAAGKHFYFDAFSDFNGVEREIIATLLDGGASVTVALHCDGIDGTAPQFAAARWTAEELRHLDETAEISVFPPASPRTYSQIFGGGAKIDAPITFLEARNETQECRMAAGEILKLVEQGARYRDITVAYCDEAAYRNVLETVFRRAEIPAYFAGDTDILRLNVIHMLLSALEAATGGMDAQTVLSYLKSGFLPIARDRCDRLENYVLLWGIRGRQWEEAWQKNPLGLKEDATEQTDALLRALNEDREGYILPLVRLRDGLKSAKNTAQMVLSLHRFTEEISLAERLEAMAQQCRSEGKLQQAQQYAQVYRLLCDLLEQMYGVLGESVRSPESFCDLFRTALSRCSVGTIPAALDCVSVGSVFAQRFADSRYLFVLGANEGFFPSAQTNQTLLSDQERSDLIEVGIDLKPSAVCGLERELGAMAGLLGVATDTLYLGGVSGRESYYLRRARNLAENAEVLTDELSLLERSRRDRLNHLMAHPNGLPKDDPLYAEAQTLLQAKQYHIGSLHDETVRVLYGKKLSLSSSKIDKLASCRLAFFLSYGLKARERKTAQVDAPEFGTFVHDILEHTARTVMKEGGFDCVTEERVLEIADERMEYYAREILAELWGSERAEYLFRRSFREVRSVVRQLRRELSVSRFRPQWFELKFGKGEAMPEVKIVGEKISAELRGVVDRADLWVCDESLYVRVVDYKTGKTTFEPKKILLGIGMQMLLYLFALRRSGAHLLGKPLHCAGVMYFPANVPKIPLKSCFDEKESSEREKLEKRTGLLLDHERMLRAMDPNEPPIFLPDRDYCATKEQFDALERFVLKTVGALADDLASGSVEANPYFENETKNACQWCDFRTLCGENVEKRRLPALKTMADFWQKVEESVHGEV